MEDRRDIGADPIGRAKYYLDCEGYEDVANAVFRMEQQLAELRDQYNDLIMQVAMKHPDETRHETAKRYIYNAEHQDNEPAAALVMEIPSYE